MATFAKQISCFSLIILSTCLQTQARERIFFSKYIHFDTNNFVTIPSTNLKKDLPSSPSPSQAPTTSQISAVPASAPVGADVGFSPAPTPITLGADFSPAPTPVGADSEFSPAPAPITLGADDGPAPAPAPENEVSYYGLYGTNTNDGEEEEFSNENREGEAYTYNNAFSTSDQKSYYDANNGYDLSNSEPQGMSDTRTVENSKYYYGEDQEKYSASKPQGMSDTRTVENGKYYYGDDQEKYSASKPQGMSDTRTVENGKYYYGDDQEKYRASEPQGMSDTRLADNGRYYGGSQQGNYSPSWGGSKSSNEETKYEFDSMEEYEKQEGYADVEQEFTSP